MKKDPLISAEDLIALLPNHVYWLDKEGVYQGCNNQQASMMGLSSRFEVVGKRNKDLPCLKNHPEIWEMLDQNNAEIMASGQAKCLEETAYDINHVFGTYLSYKVPLRDKDNHVIGLLGVSYKIDDIKEG